MKKTLLGGFIFLGGSIIYSAGTVASATVYVQLHKVLYMPHIGVICMIVGAIIAILDIKKSE